MCSSYFRSLFFKMTWPTTSISTWTCSARSMNRYTTMFTVCTVLTWSCRNKFTKTILYKEKKSFTEIFPDFFFYLLSIFSLTGIPNLSVNTAVQSSYTNKVLKTVKDHTVHESQSKVNQKSPQSSKQKISQPQHRPKLAFIYTPRFWPFTFHECTEFWEMLFQSNLGKCCYGWWCTE